MRVFGRLLMVALLAGLAAALAQSLLQRLFLLPILVDAENYYYAARVADWHEIIHVFGQHRALMLTLVNIAIGFGYALLLASAMTLHSAGEASSGGAFRGLLWGIAGYLVFAAIPAMTLGAGLPGQVLAPLAQRQWWWLFSVSAAAVGLTLVFSGRIRTRWIRLLGILLFILPLGIGAPAVIGSSGESLIPSELAQAFNTTRHLVNAAFWSVLGLATGYLLRPRKRV